MGRPRKNKELARKIKVVKQRKVRTKKVKNSFLEINKSYEFYFQTKYENDSVIGKLLASNAEELSIEHINSNRSVILIRKNIYMAIEYEGKSITSDNDY